MGMIKISHNELVSSVSVENITVSYESIYKPNESVYLGIKIDLMCVGNIVKTIKYQLFDTIKLNLLHRANALIEADGSLNLNSKTNDELCDISKRFNNSKYTKEIEDVALELFNIYMVSTGDHLDPSRKTFNEYLEYLYSLGTHTEYIKFYKLTRGLYNSIYRDLEAKMEELALRRLQIIHGGDLDAIYQELYGMTVEEYNKEVAKVEKEDAEFEKVVNMTNTEAREYYEHRKLANIMNKKTED